MTSFVATVKYRRTIRDGPGDPLRFHRSARCRMPSGDRCLWGVAAPTATLIRRLCYDRPGLTVADQPTKR